MCGISGIYQKGKVSEAELKKTVKRMNEIQNRRGPDDEGVFVDGENGLAFGHRRLSILDLSKAGHQPMQLITNNQKLITTFNGEIYNFLELKKDLEKKGYKFKTKTDTEVILALYSEYGEKSFPMLRGMFAFGLWDAKKQKLFLVKDRYGIKPFYYYSDKEKLIFASTIKAIVKSGQIAVQKNPQAMIGFLLFGSVPLPLTTIKNVLAVPAGHYLTREADGSQKIIKYYDSLEPFLKKTNDDLNGAVLKTRKLLEDSANAHLISDAPLGVFLSGGLDSSAIAALSAEAMRESGAGRKITTLSIIFDEPEFSEERYSDLVAGKIGSDHKKIKITKQDFNDSFDEIFEAMDQPTIDGVNSFFIARAAKTAGLKTVLSGLGADEIFLGYPHFRRAEFLRKIQNLPRFSKTLLFNYPITQLLNYLTDNSRYSKLSYFTNDDILSFYLGIRGLFSPQETARILGVNLSEVENFIKEILITQLSNQQINQLHPVDLLSYFELKFYLQNQLLKDTDFMSMYHSIEARVPFLDHKLVEYVSSLPPQAKSNPIRKLKPLLATAVNDLLPQEVLNRVKMGFTFPFQKWLPSNVKGQMLNVGTHWSRFWAKIVLNKFK